MHSAHSGSPLPASPPASSLPWLRQADSSDLNVLCDLENRCFDPIRRDTKRMIQRGLSSGREVWVVECDGAVRASMFLRPVKKTLRIYSIATEPAYQGKGFGHRLMNKAFEQGRRGSFRRLSLEVDASHCALVSWYGRFGFIRERFLREYYGPGRDALRLRRSLVDSDNE